MDSHMTMPRVPTWQLSHESSRQIAKMLHVMAGADQLHVLWILGHGPRTISELSQVIGASASQTGHLLSKLRSAGLVKLGKPGQRVVYLLASDEIKALVNAAVNLGAVQAKW